MGLPTASVFRSIANELSANNAKELRTPPRAAARALIRDRDVSCRRNVMPLTNGYPHRYRNRIVVQVGYLFYVAAKNACLRKYTLARSHHGLCRPGRGMKQKRRLKKKWGSLFIYVIRQTFVRPRHSPGTV